MLNVFSKVGASLTLVAAMVSSGAHAQQRVDIKKVNDMMLKVITEAVKKDELITKSKLEVDPNYTSIEKGSLKATLEIGLKNTDWSDEESELSSTVKVKMPTETSVAGDGSVTLKTDTTSLLKFAWNKAFGKPFPSQGRTAEEIAMDKYLGETVLNGLNKADTFTQSAEVLIKMWDDLNALNDILIKSWEDKIAAAEKSDNPNDRKLIPGFKSKLASSKSDKKVFDETKVSATKTGGKITNVHVEGKVYEDKNVKKGQSMSVKVEADMGPKQTVLTVALAFDGLDKRENDSYKQMVVTTLEALQDDQEFERNVDMAKSVISFLKGFVKSEK